MKNSTNYHFLKSPLTAHVNLLDCWHFHMLVNVLKSVEVRYLLYCRVLAKAVELQGVWLVSEADTGILKVYR